MSKESKKPTVILGNNITAKFKSATFWTGMIPVLATFVVSVLSLLGVNGAEDIVNQYTAIATTLVSILAGLGVLVSHDTKGIADSEIAQTFTKPRDSKDPDQGLTWENNSEDGVTTSEPVPMPPKEHGEKDIEDDFEEAEPLEKLDSETPEDNAKEEDKEDSPKG